MIDGYRTASIDVGGNDQEGRGPASPVGRVRVIANRLPVTAQPGGGWVPAPGGLAAALSTLTGNDTGNLDWVGARATLDTDAEPSWDNGSMHLVDVDSHIFADAIGGMANSVLWPALHGFDSLVRWREPSWDAYCAYNRAFAWDIIRTASAGDVVWFHDYHLLLAPALVKLVRPDISVGLSFHTPIDPESLAELPVAGQLAVAIDRPDLVGVQTETDRRSLRTLLDEEAAVMVSPVSIDPHALRRLAHTPPVESLIAQRRSTGRSVIVGVDRLDYTKAIAERLVAYDLAFERGHLHPDDVHIVQIAQPSRTDLADYQALRLEVERLAHQVRSRWIRSDGTPAIEVHVDLLQRNDVIAWLAAADIAVVTPARDGMNLVAKEFSALSADWDPVLVLSQHAGAAAELGDGSILVDGADPRSVADGLMAARTLTPRQRTTMAKARKSAVDDWTSRDWSTAFIDGLRQMSIRTPDDLGHLVQ